MAATPNARYPPRDDYGYDEYSRAPRMNSFELHLVTPTGECYPEIFDENRCTWVIAEQGQQFFVRLSADMPPEQPYKIQLHIDGQFKCCPTFPAGKTTHDITGSPDADRTIRAFIFSPSAPNQAEIDKGVERVGAEAVDNVGRVTIRVFTVRALKNQNQGQRRRDRSRSPRRGGPDDKKDFGDSGSAPLDESFCSGEKFWKHPGLRTMAGPAIGRRETPNSNNRLVADEYVTKLELRYESPARLELRGLLHRNDPTHSKMLTRFRRLMRGQEAHSDVKKSDLPTCDLTGEKPTWKCKDEKKDAIEIL